MAEHEERIHEKSQTRKRPEERQFGRILRVCRKSSNRRDKFQDNGRRFLMVATGRIITERALSLKNSRSAYSAFIPLGNVNFLSHIFKLTQEYTILHKLLCSDLHGVLLRGGDAEDSGDGQGVFQE